MLRDSQASHDLNRPLLLDLDRWSQEIIFEASGAANFTNNEDPDAMPQYLAVSSDSTLFVKVKKISSDKIQYCFDTYNRTPLDMYNGVSQIDLSNWKIESISIQSIKQFVNISGSKP